MRKISKIEPTLPVIPTRKKVAAYARVSRDTERLIHSVSAQISYYSTLIQKNPEREYAGVYADCGISGTDTAKRGEFLRMLDDCEEGKIDIILTKSISRFARNTVDLLETVRHLKSLGIEVRFEKEHINSLSEDGELMLTLLASFAQEESRSISENVKWGVRKRFQSGEIGAANKHILGYRYDDELRKYVIIPEEAEAARWMFQMYLDGVSFREIAENMNNAGIRTTLGNGFQEASVRQLIFNEIYAGDILRQKCYMADPITKMKVKNCGELPQYYMADCHEAIIDRETYAKVQAEMERRAGLVNPTYPFTGKIKCGICGQNFTRRKGITKGKEYVSWFCRAKKEVGMSCTSHNYSERKLMEICAELMETGSFDETAFERSVRFITALPDGSLEVQFFDGHTKRWEMPPKPVKPPKEPAKKRPSHIFDGKIFCGKCGRRFGRAISDTTDGGHLYWYCRASHEPIIPSCEFELVQAEFLRRKRIGRSYNSKSIFTARLVCECCGGYFGSKVWHSTSKYRRTVWQCNHKFKNGEKCTTPHLYEEHIKDKFLIAMNSILANRDEIIENCMILSEDFSHDDKLQEKINCIELEKEAVSKKIRQLIQRHSIKPMKAEEYYRQCDILNNEYNALETKEAPLLQKKEDMLVKRKFILDYVEMLKTQDCLITEFSETLWLKSIDHVTICTNGGMAFCFKDGTEIRG